MKSLHEMVYDHGCKIEALKEELGDLSGVVKELMDEPDFDDEPEEDEYRTYTIAGFAKTLGVELDIGTAIMCEHRAEELSEKNHCPVGRTIDRGVGSQNVYCEGVLKDVFFFALRQHDPQ